LNEAFVDVDNLEDGQVVGDYDEDDEAPPEEDEDEFDQDGSAGQPEGEVEMQEDLDTGPDDALNVLEAHADAAIAVAWHPTDPTLLASGGCDERAFLWRVAGTGPDAVVEKQELVGHTDTVTALAFSMDGGLLATAGLDGKTLIWDARGNKTTQLEGPAEGLEFVCWHPKGPVVLAGSEDYSAWMWNAKTGACMQVFTGHSGSVNCGAFTPDGKSVITGSADGTLRIWDPRSGTCTFTVQGHPYHEGALTCLDVSADGGLVISGSEDKTAKLVNVAGGKCKGTLDGHLDSVECAKLCRSMPVAASGSMDGTCMVWDLATLQMRATLPHGEGVVKLAWHPTSPLVYTACLDGRLRMWDARTGGCVRALGGHKAGVQDLSVRSDGQCVVTAADDHSVRIFSAA